MKAYQIKIDMIDSEPSIWRSVVMPAGATFNRLHDVIQTVLNFQDYHLFEFDLTKDKIRVTNDEEAYQEHQYFKKNQKEMEKQMEEVLPEFAEFEKARLEQLKKVVRKPNGIKIDSYLEKHGELYYIYDFGDDWRVLVTLEKVMENYHYGYPTLLTGEGTAPPEDVGGFMGYSEFLKIYHDPDHPDHEDMKTWANSQLYREYDPEFISGMLKFVKYKKTEWDNLR
ncbi:hypothetical protein CIL03_00325 [Virgibacillus indicus]|uniref:Plasmid pRiA4b Orf3-like domain-containing protein n=1 Tax=Virgibacillus indicus TaxID=2024554 RepID=A0A265NEA6_9BACI|nr:plasmid pRiA4b ORF-3 family protein [Virgibacillus indicus]OZU89626.1 hypothetical protein CIL03_00325 [Virgibacillus indicus]